MQKNNVEQLLTQRTPVLLDGASGTQMIAAGMPAGVCPELWASEHEPLLAAMHRGYVEAGSQIVYAFTFGANPIKLREYGLEQRMEELNRRLVRVAKEAAGNRALVAGDMAPTGAFIAPMGPLSFEEVVEAYALQARALAEAGVDLFAVETMVDVQETRAAILGIRSVSDLPIFVTLSFDEAGRTLTGTDARTAALTLCGMGIQAVGANCGLGPAGMEPVIRAMHAVAEVPIIAKPNAGLPTGEVLPPEVFVQQMQALVQCGAQAIGGCCGTDPAYIALLRERVGHMATQGLCDSRPRAALTSREQTVYVGEGQPLCTIGERLNPTGKKKLQQALREGDDEYLLQMAYEQMDQGARVLDVNVGMNGIDEVQTLWQKVQFLAGRTAVPLCLDSANADALAQALRVYPGRALVNSVSAEHGKAEALFPLIARYGAMYIALPIGDDGVPETAQQRIALLQQILAKAAQYGIPRERCVVDALAMSVASQGDAAQQALGVIDYCHAHGLQTVMGVSNISFGLPARAQVNAALLLLARARGLSCAIVNVCEPTMHGAVAASDALLLGEEAVAAYALGYTQQEISQPEGLSGAVFAGERGRARALAQQLLQEGMDPQQVIAQSIAGLDQLGEQFAQKKAFLPQLMAGAEAAKEAFACVEPLLLGTDAQKLARVVIATVQGDIHDIGKNIVALMLRNHGFDVIDLGRDVKNERIVEAAKAYQAQIVVLSALLTTTMPRMGEVAQMLRAEGLGCTLMVGGAVVTPEYAEQIGALYSKDAAEAVEVAKAALHL